MDLYIGLMSGTSVDGIDAALVDFSQPYPTIIATYYSPFTQALREQILALCFPGENEIQRLGELDTHLGKAFAEAAKALLQQQRLSPDTIKAIGSHGQTIRHSPNSTHRFTLQIGDPNTIAAETGITTVADFRRKDIALGGQGAPLVPAFHQHIFNRTDTNRAIVNIGGIANITILPKHAANMLGYDTGPGNVLLNAWIHKHQQKTHDDKGMWAETGKLNEKLLERLLADPYFTFPIPKSTGREYFNLAWLEKNLQEPVSAVDVQTTLTYLTARSIMDAIRLHIAEGEILICGGGAHNTFLINLLKQLAKSYFSVCTTESYGVHPDWVEAMAFAWLARQTLNKQPGNLPLVTGARRPAILGSIFYGE